MPGRNIQPKLDRLSSRISGFGGIFFTSFVVGLSGALMPGPLLALTVSSVVEHGFWAGPLLMVGHAAGELLVVIALVKGIGRLLQRKVIIGTIGLVGGSFLLWMSYGLLMTADKVLIFQPGSGTSIGFGIPTIMAGLVVSITNPYWVLWWGTVGTTYVAWARDNRKTGGVSIFFVGHELSDLIWYSVVSIVVAGGASLLSPGIYKALLTICGVALFGLALYFIVSGTKSIMDGRRAPRTPL